MVRSAAVTDWPALKRPAGGSTRQPPGTVKEIGVRPKERLIQPFWPTVRPYSSGPCDHSDGLPPIRLATSAAVAGTAGADAGAGTVDTGAGCGGSCGDGTCTVWGGGTPYDCCDAVGGDPYTGEEGVAGGGGCRVWVGKVA